MATAMDVDESFSDEDWLVNRSRSLLKTNQYAAKACLITARTLFPRNFIFQMEAYNIEKSNKQVAASARLLEDMFLAFSHEKQLWNEVEAISEALQSDNTDANTIFLKDVFAALPPDLQCRLLLTFASTASDLLHQCRLTLLVLYRYPDRVADKGLNLIEMLLTTEKQSHPQSPLNSYRKYLVCDVLPLVLRQKLTDVSHKHIYHWLQKAIEFYVTCLTQVTETEPTGMTSPDLKSPTRKPSLSHICSSPTRLVIPGLPEKECMMEQPWTQLCSLLELVAQQLNWNIRDLCSKTSSRESQWQCLHAMHQANIRNTDPGVSHKQLLYCTLVIFMDCVTAYSRQVDPESFPANANQCPLVLLEIFKSSFFKERHSPPKAKKARHDAGPPQIHVNKTIQQGPTIVQNFTTALKCWELLHTEKLQKDFGKFCSQWKTENWPWLKSFEIDVLIFQGLYREAVNKLHTFISSGKASQMRADLQLGCCYYSLGNYSKACDSILNVVGSLDGGSTPSTDDLMSQTPGRHLHLLQCNESQILPFCMQLMITCFREKAFKIGKQDDTSLGHMIVLLQYDWPRYEALFSEAALRIQQNGTFTYNLFFNYIINVDILEEFAYLRTPEGGKVNLDILPDSVKSIAHSRTVTRGVNKGVKEDFRATLEKQVARSSENIESVIRTFLTEEKEYLQQNLT